MPAAKDRFDRYGVTLFQDDDSDYLAHLTELPSISAFSHTPEWALDELATAWKLVKEEYAAEAKPVPVAPSRREYGGVFQVRIDRGVHRALVIEA